MLDVFPSKTKFMENAWAGRVSPVYAELPLLPSQQIYETVKAPNSVLLESIKGPEKIARYSFIAADPFLIFRVKNGAVEIGHNAKISISEKPPLKRLRELMGMYRINSEKALPPFIGGAVGIIGYDFVHYFERLPRTAFDDLTLPDAHFMLVDTVIAIDHKLRKTFLISCPAAESVITESVHSIRNWGIHYDRAREKLNALHKKIGHPHLGTSRFQLAGGRELMGSPRQTWWNKGAVTSSSTRRSGPGRRGIKIRHEMGKRDYMTMVQKAKEYIRAGDIFQANLSQRVSADIGDSNPWHIYKVLSSINPSPFAGYLDMGDYIIASSSPERLVKVSGNRVETRPIAGTRPRGINEEDDRLMRKDLLLNEKERAEHLMLIDLERNDLGKISDYSTVEVDELMITEEYSHVIHIVSNIKGTIVNGRDCFDAIRATFPGGTITGVPKVRCMEIIDELEPVVRGPYTGSLGYISFTGDMDLNIVIRTFVIKDQRAYVQAGAGIVADSDPEREYFEALKKAEALIKTLEIL